MKKVLLSLLLLVPVMVFGTYFYLSSKVSGAPPYYVVDDPGTGVVDSEVSILENWKRPDGPPKVGLQVGHWKNNEIPEELKRLEGNTGASGGGKSEWEVNLRIAEETKKLLEDQGIVVDILPATVPERYWADVFVAIHADGSLEESKSGFKAATPRRDLTGKGNLLLNSIEASYEEATDLEKDPNVTRNMRGYYAFSWWRFNHAVHPMTTALILETGFLTSPSDRQIIVQNPEVSAQGLANGIINFFKEQKML